MRSIKAVIVQRLFVKSLTRTQLREAIGEDEVIDKALDDLEEAGIVEVTFSIPLRVLRDLVELVERKKR